MKKEKFTFKELNEKYPNDDAYLKELFKNRYKDKRYLLMVKPILIQQRVFGLNLKGQLTELIILYTLNTYNHMLMNFRIDTIGENKSPLFFIL